MYIFKIYYSIWQSQNVTHFLQMADCGVPFVLLLKTWWKTKYKYDIIVNKWYCILISSIESSVNTFYVHNWTKRGNFCIYFVSKLPFPFSFGHCDIRFLNHYVSRNIYSLSILYKHYTLKAVRRGLLTKNLSTVRVYQAPIRA